MPSKRLPNLTPDQVEALQDALLSNADALLMSALAVLDLGHGALARSLAILGLEESGKAIAVHERRVEMYWTDETEAFTDDRLAHLWRDHVLKLRAVHRFLEDEQYWFDVSEPDREANAAALGAIEAWAGQQNRDKKDGFYVDVAVDGNPVAPSDSDGEARLPEIIRRVHQIGWQLRLGEHIEMKRQRELEELRDLRPEAELSAGGRSPGNVRYAFRPPDGDTAGKRGYEAQTRELELLRARLDDGRDGSADA